MSISLVYYACLKTGTTTNESNETIAQERDTYILVHYEL